MLDAAKKLNDVKSLRGLDRYFKQIAQSARYNKSNGDANVDDFLGCLNIKISELPTCTVEKWYDLESRRRHDQSSGSGSRKPLAFDGKIRLRLKLKNKDQMPRMSLTGLTLSDAFSSTAANTTANHSSGGGGTGCSTGLNDLTSNSVHEAAAAAAAASQVTNDDYGDNCNEFNQHEQLLSLFIEHDLDKHHQRRQQHRVNGTTVTTSGRGAEWKGTLCFEAETILQEHASRYDITPFQLALW